MYTVHTLVNSVYTVLTLVNSVYTVHTLVNSVYNVHTLVNSVYTVHTLINSTFSNYIQGQGPKKLKNVKKHLANIICVFDYVVLPAPKKILLQ